MEFFMISDEKMTEWRDIWQEIIETSRLTLIEETQNYKHFDEIEDKYPKDKMILFEKAITAECLGDLPTATEFYKKASDEENGLPVKHWRDRAEYFFERINTKKQCHVLGELDKQQSLRNVQLDIYYNAHSYCHLDDYIRYLAISSISRFCSEPAMAIVIFRTCLEIGIWTYFEEDANDINEYYQQKNNKDSDWEVDLKDLLKGLKNKGLPRKEYDLFFQLKEYGNKAAHPGKIKKEPPYKYDDSELIDILECFNKTLFILNKYAEKKFRLA